QPRSQCRRRDRRPGDRHVPRQGGRSRPDAAGARESCKRLHTIAADGQVGRRSTHRPRPPSSHGRRRRGCANIIIKPARSTAMSGIVKWCMAAACVLALAGADPGRANAQATPKRGGTALVGVSVAAATLNTQLTSAVTPLIIADLWASGLFKYDKTGNKKPQIASSWEISKDGKVYTFHLRPNLKWSDGHPFSSEDVAFTLKAFAQYNTYLVKVQPNIERIETPDANTFVVYLKEPQSSALEGFDKEVFPLMPKHIYDGTDIPTNPANRAPVGMGPYRFVKWEEGRGVTFERNEYYWDQPRPYLDSVVAVFIPTLP